MMSLDAINELNSAPQGDQLNRRQLSDLPLELIYEILSHLPDLRDRRNFFWAFKPISEIDLSQCENRMRGTKLEALVKSINRLIRHFNPLMCLDFFEALQLVKREIASDPKIAPHRELAFLIKRSPKLLDEASIEALVEKYDYWELLGRIFTIIEMGSLDPWIPSEDTSHGRGALRYYLQKNSSILRDIVQNKRDEDQEFAALLEKKRALSITGYKKVDIASFFDSIEDHLFFQVIEALCKNCPTLLIPNEIRNREQIEEQLSQNILSLDEAGFELFIDFSLSKLSFSVRDLETIRIIFGDIEDYPLNLSINHPLTSLITTTDLFNGSMITVAHLHSLLNLLHSSFRKILLLLSFIESHSDDDVRQNLCETMISLAEKACYEREERAELALIHILKEQKRVYPAYENGKESRRCAFFRDFVLFLDKLKACEANSPEHQALQLELVAQIPNIPLRDRPRVLEALICASADIQPCPLLIKAVESPSMRIALYDNSFSITNCPVDVQEAHKNELRELIIEAIRETAAYDHQRRDWELAKILVFLHLPSYRLSATYSSYDEIPSEPFNRDASHPVWRRLLDNFGAIESLFPEESKQIIRHIENENLKIFLIQKLHDSQVIFDDSELADLIKNPEMATFLRIKWSAFPEDLDGDALKKILGSVPNLSDLFEFFGERLVTRHTPTIIESVTEWLTRGDENLYVNALRNFIDPHSYEKSLKLSLLIHPVEEKFSDIKTRDDYNLALILNAIAAASGSYRWIEYAERLTSEGAKSHGYFLIIKALIGNIGDYESAKTQLIDKVLPLRERDQIISKLWDFLREKIEYNHSLSADEALEKISKAGEFALQMLTLISDNYLRSQLLKELAIRNEYYERKLKLVFMPPSLQPWDPTEPDRAEAFAHYSRAAKYKIASMIPVAAVRNETYRILDKMASNG